MLDKNVDFRENYRALKIQFDEIQSKLDKIDGYFMLSDDIEEPHLNYTLIDLFNNNRNHLQQISDRVDTAIRTVEISFIILFCMMTYIIFI
jgi:hypothetical protein